MVPWDWENEVYQCFAPNPLLFNYVTYFERQTQGLTWCVCVCVCVCVHVHVHVHVRVCSYKSYLEKKGSKTLKNAHKNLTNKNTEQKINVKKLYLND